MTEFTIALSSGKKPLYEQIYRYVADSIMSGDIKEGERLPGKRSLAKHLGVSVSTVEGAYAILAAEGFLSAEPRRGFFACRVESRAEAPTQTAHVPATPDSPVYRYTFSTSSIDVSLFPYKLWAKLSREVLTEQRDLLNRGDGMGDMNLRAALSDFLRLYRGVNLRPEQLLVGAGLEYLLGMLVRILGGAHFALEDPGYGATYRAILRSGGRATPVPLDSQGMSISALANAQADIAYVTPSHQFPLGITMSAGRRAELLNWAGQQAGRYIIEDDYDSEFRHNIRPIPAMQGYDAAGNVVYAGTFSRTLAPSIRIAYLGLPDALLKKYHALFDSTASTVSRFEQQTLFRFIQSGAYARHLRRAGNTYKQRAQLLIQTLQKIDGLRLSGEGAGLHFLAAHPRLSENELVARAAREGVKVHAVSEYAHAAPIPPSTVVLGYAGLGDQDIQPAAEALVRAWTLARPD